MKAFEKVEARTKIEIDKAQSKWNENKTPQFEKYFYYIKYNFKVTPTIRKCVSQKEISSLQSLGINVKNGCHDIRTAKRRHKLYCFCENDLCNEANKIIKHDKFLFVITLSLIIFLNLY